MHVTIYIAGSLIVLFFLFFKDNIFKTLAFFKCFKRKPEFDFCYSDDLLSEYNYRQLYLEMVKTQREI